MADGCCSTKWRHHRALPNLDKNVEVKNLISPPHNQAMMRDVSKKRNDGPDIKANMLCLCPNHHKLMDCGGIVIDDSYRIIQVLDGKQLGILRMSHRHRVSQEYLSWHRSRWLQA